MATDVLQPVQREGELIDVCETPGARIQARCMQWIILVDSIYILFICCSYLIHFKKPIITLPEIKS